MDITYVTQSRFLPTSEEVIRRSRDRLLAGDELAIEFEDGGYPGTVSVTIRLGDQVSFGTDWEGGDVTRFPARVKAAATALRNCSCFGQFVITHADGRLTVRLA